MANNVTNRRISIYIDQASAEASQKRLQADFDKTAKKVRDLQKAGKDATTEMAKMERIKGDLETVNGVLSGKLTPSFNMVKKNVVALRAELRKMSEDAPGYAEKLKRYEQVSAEFDRMKQKVGGVRSSLKELTGAVVGGNLLTAALFRLREAVGSIFTGNERLSESLTDVQRTTGVTAEQVSKLNKDLKQVDTRTAQDQLLKIAEIGGLFHVPTEQLEGFIEQVNKMNVVLGKEFEGGAEEVTTQMALLRNVFIDIKSDNIASDIGHIGNALIVLAHEGAATAPIMSEFAKRIAPIEATAKVTTGQVLGLSAALQELAVNPQRGGTAVVKIFADMSSHAEQFAKVAGKSIEDFKNELNANAFQAFLDVLSGFNKGGKDVIALNDSLANLGEDGVRTQEVLVKLSQNVDLLREKSVSATEALTNTASITEKYDLYNNNLSANVSKLGKVFTNLVTSTGMIDFLNNLVLGTRQLVNVLISTAGFIKDNIAAFSLLTAGYLLSNSAIKAGIIARAKNIASLVAEKTATIATTIAEKADIVTTTALSAVKALLAGNIAKARAEFKLLTVTLGSNPLGAILIAAGALVLTLKLLIDRSKELTSEQRVAAQLSERVNDATSEQISKIQSLTNTIKDNKIALGTRKQALQELININPQYLNGLTLENIKTAEGKKLIDQYTDAIKKKSEAEALSELRTDKYKELLKLKNEKQKIAQQGPDLTTVSGQLEEQLLEKIGQGVVQKIAAIDEKIKSAQEDLDNIDKQTTSNLEKQAQSVSDNTKNKTKTVGDEIDELKKKIKDLKEAYLGLSASDTQGQEANLAKQHQLNEQLQALEDKQYKQRATKQQKLEDQVQKLYDDLKNITKDYTVFAASQYDKDIINAYQRFQKLEDRADKYIKDSQKRTATIKQIHELRDKALNEITDKYIKQADFKNEAYNKKQQAAFEKRAAQAAKQFAQNAKNITASINADNLSKAQLDVLNAPAGKAKLQAQLHQLEVEREAELSNTKLTENQRLLIIKEYEDKEAELRKQYALDRAQTILNSITDIANAYSAFDQLQTSRENNELARDKALNDQKKKNLEDQLNSKRLTRQQYDKAVSQLDKEAAAKQQAIQIEQFKRSQKMQAVQAAMSGANAIVSTLAAIPGPIDIATLGTLRAIELAFVAATTAAEVGFILAQKPPESYGHGGAFLQGPKHSSPSKGMPVYDPNSGHIAAYMEGGEGVTNARAMSSREQITATGTPSQITSAINSRYGGVAWTSGGTIAPRWATQPPSKINIGGIQKAYQQARMFAAGGVFGREQPSGVGNQQPITVSVDTREQNDLLRQQNAILMQMMNNPVPVSLYDINRQQARLTQIQDNARLKK